MAECHSMIEQMPMLLTESLDATRRELTHQHIESCDVCREEWNAYRETWSMMAELADVEPPARIKQKFLAQVLPAAALPSNVVPFHRRQSTKWFAQAAAVVLLVGGSYIAGHRSAPAVTLPETQATLTSMTPHIERVSATNAPLFKIAESNTLKADDVSPTIEGRPDIQNVQFTRTKDEMGVSFDITQHVTVTGSPNDKSMVRLMSYVLENEDHMSSKSRAIDMVRQTYSTPQSSDPEITSSLAKVLRYDAHEGVRIKAVDTLTTNQQPSLTAETRQALIDALKSDPNPAVRIKAVEALLNLAKSGGTLDTAMVDTLRAKASQDDENPYVRVKAAEALSNVRP